MPCSKLSNMSLPLTHNIATSYGAGLSGYNGVRNSHPRGLRRCLQWNKTRLITDTSSPGGCNHRSSQTPTQDSPSRPEFA